MILEKIPYRQLFHFSWMTVQRTHTQLCSTITTVQRTQTQLCSTRNFNVQGVRTKQTGRFDYSKKLITGKQDHAKSTIEKVHSKSKT
jgi:hypothetical protein